LHERENLFIIARVLGTRIVDREPRMSALVSAFIAGRYQRLLLAMLWGALLAALLGIGYGFIVWQVTSSIGRDQRAELARITEIRRNAVYALQKLKQEATTPPCSPDFLAVMQRVAFLPDGLNEFLYAPNGRVECSTSRPKFETPVPLGAPDVDSSGANAPSLRIDRDLASIGRSGTMGTIAQLGAFAVAIPPYTRYQNDATWLKKELVALGPHGKVWSIAGDRGLYHRLSSSADVAGRPTTIASTLCDDERLYCVASRADLFAWARDWAPILSSIAVLAALFAWVCATNIIGWLSRYWSFEARFNRHLDTKSVLVVYQPVLDLRSGKISGCEVLARWRDIDGTIVAPSRFIEIVERTGRTEEFTRLVADRAYEELSACLPSATRLQVAFNVFACDLDSAKLLAIYSRFLDGDRRFEPAIELVESHDIDFEAAERAIDARLGWDQVLHRRFRHRLLEHRARGDARRARREARPLFRHVAARQHHGTDARAGAGDDQDDGPPDRRRGRGDGSPARSSAGHRDRRLRAGLRDLTASQH
jgi:sensor c-di-GMP phosphodiesterase-like protein